ncbi:ATP-binding protein [Neobacillus sp. 19]|uniref:ATP-binding protein n=1 Tax=Neobacillus sp. 19 TaxID=3394458 RepID=UPI003BF68DE1
MSQRVRLRDIFIGNVDGEEESERYNFEQLFYNKDSKYDEIMSPNKFIISGRKGTGKTYLAKYIIKKCSEKQISCKLLKKEDFKLQKFLDLQYRDLKEDELPLFWKWTFLLQMANVMLSEQKIKTKIPWSSSNKLKKFIKLKYPDGVFRLKDFNKTQSRKSNLTGNQKITGQSIAATIEDLNSVSSNYGQREYFESLNSLESLVFKCLVKHKDIILIYDDLDDLEDSINNHHFYCKLLISMLEMIQYYNRKFQRIKKNNTKIIALLRSDIIDDIHSNSSNSNKLTSEGRVNLYWIDKIYQSPEEHPLMEMILNKIKKSLNNNSNLTNKELYKLYFPKKIRGKEVIDYLLDYSFGRPRDIVSYLNFIKSTNPEEYSFEPNSFLDCSQKYSRWFTDELKNEISINEHKNMILNGLQLINNFKRQNFSYSQIDLFYERNKGDYPNIVNLKETLKYLYKLGVIGNSWRHGKPKPDGSYNYRYSWGYRDDASEVPNFSNTFVVHYGFRKHFSL